MNCTKCTTNILKGEKYHRTKKGPHHAQCPHVSVAIPNDGGPAVVKRDDGHASAEQIAADILSNCAAKFVHPEGYASTPQEVINQQIANAVKILRRWQKVSRD